jgi:hypothetical protein
MFMNMMSLRLSAGTKEATWVPALAGPSAGSQAANGLVSTQWQKIGGRFGLDHTMCWHDVTLSRSKSWPVQSIKKHQPMHHDFSLKLFGMD